MSDNLQDIDRRINDLWSKGRFTEAGSIISNELLPVIVDYLVSGKGLIKEDAEDAVGDAHRGFLKKISEKGPHSIATPKPYIWQAAVRRGTDYLKNRSKAEIPESQLACSAEGEQSVPHDYLDHQFHSGAARGLIPTWQMRATFLVEGLIAEVEITQSDAVTLVRETLTRLSSVNGEIINHVLQYGPGQPAAEAARILKIKTANNFGVRKYRAYKEFREIAPKVACELGIQWRGVTEDEVSADVVENPEFMPSYDAPDEHENADL